MQNLLEHSQYKHRPLEDDATLRILKVQQAQPDSELICHLKHTDDAENDDHSIEGQDKNIGYEALSWCWGESIRERGLTIIDENDRSWSLAVKEGLYAALKALRRPDRPRYLWVDCISIDQSNVSERNHQVSRMSEIFGQASNVCIWLGEESLDSTKAIDFIKNNLSKPYKFDEHCSRAEYLHHWVAFMYLMKRQWFQRRWIVQEVALARRATIHCGDHFVDWEDFQSAVSSIVDSEGVLEKLSTLAREDKELGNPREYFAGVPTLGAAQLVDVTNRLFRRNVNNVLQRTSKLEEIVAELPLFETTEPRDVIYALLALAKDSQPAIMGSVPDFLFGKRLNDHQKRLLKKISKALPKFYQESYPVKYDQSVMEVYQQFIRFAMERSEPERALDILCRPFAKEFTYEDDARFEKRETKLDPLRAKELVPLPSWIPNVSDMPFVKHSVRSEHRHHGIGEHVQSFTMEREAGDLFVSPPGSVSFYAAAGLKKCDMRRIRFRRRRDHFSMFVEGFILDEIGECEETSQYGDIPKSWLKLAKRHESEDSGAFCRTLVADRGPKDVTPPFYRRTLQEVLSTIPPDGSLNIQNKFKEPLSSQVTEVLKHVVRTTTGRNLVKTKTLGLLGLAPRKTRPGDCVCILYGCSVPIILRPSAEPRNDERDTQDDIASLEQANKHLIDKLGRWLKNRKQARDNVPNPYPVNNRQTSQTDNLSVSHPEPRNQGEDAGPSSEPRADTASEAVDTARHNAAGTTHSDEASTVVDQRATEAASLDTQQPRTNKTKQTHQSHRNLLSSTVSNTQVRRGVLLCLAAMLLIVHLRNDLSAFMLLAVASPHLITDAITLPHAERLLFSATHVLFLAGMLQMSSDRQAPLLAVISLSFVFMLFPKLLPPLARKMYFDSVTTVLHSIQTLLYVQSQHAAQSDDENVDSYEPGAAPAPQVGNERRTEASDSPNGSPAVPPTQSRPKRSATLTSMPQPRASKREQPPPDHIAETHSFEFIGESYIDTMMTGNAIAQQNASTLRDRDRMWAVTFEIR